MLHSMSGCHLQVFTKIWQTCKDARPQLLKLLNTWTSVFPDEMLAVIRQRIAVPQATIPASRPFASTVPALSPAGPNPLQMQGQGPGSVPLVSKSWSMASANGHLTPAQAAPLVPSYPAATFPFSSMNYQQQQMMQYPQQPISTPMQRPSHHGTFSGFNGIQPAAPSQPAALQPNHGSSAAPASTTNILQVLLQAGMLSMPSNDAGMGMQHRQTSSPDAGLDSLSPKDIKVLHQIIQSAHCLSLSDLRQQSCLWMVPLHDEAILSMFMLLAWCLNGLLLYVRCPCMGCACLFLQVWMEGKHVTSYSEERSSEDTECYDGKLCSESGKHMTLNLQVLNCSCSALPG